MRESHSNGMGKDMFLYRFTVGFTTSQAKARTLTLTCTNSHMMHLFYTSYPSSG